jgi:hypothetical protein
MSLKPKVLTLDEQRTRLERRANVIRSRLLRTIDALDKRRHQVEEIGHQAKRLAMPVGAAFVGMVLLSAGSVLVVRALVRNRRERRLGYRVARALEPLRQQKRPSFWSEALRNVSLTALSIVAGELVKRGVGGVLVARPPRALVRGEPSAGSA